MWGGRPSSPRQRTSGATPAVPGTVGYTGAAPPTRAGRVRLAGARAGGGADGLVLLALDGGDDVAHVRAAGAAQRGQQGTLAEHPQVADPVRGDNPVMLVDEARDLGGDR